MVVARFLIAFFLISLGTHSAWGESLFERRLRDGRTVFQVLVERGAPREALNSLFIFFDFNEGRIVNTTQAVLVDFTRPSTEKRLLLLNLRTAAIERFYVAHGIRTGVLQSRFFSNIPDSWRSSLGFYYAKGTYISEKNGLSLYLNGIDRSNNNARSRGIVLHGAKYVSDEFIARNGRLGWSEGCFAVAQNVSSYLANLLKNGSVIFSYHRDLMGEARRYPWEQRLAGDEVVPPGVNRNRTPGEGGGFDFESSFNPLE